MNSERIETNSNNDNGWASLGNLPKFNVDTSNWTETKSGIVIPGAKEAPRTDSIITPSSNIEANNVTPTPIEVQNDPMTVIEVNDGSINEIEQDNTQIDDNERLTEPKQTTGQIDDNERLTEPKQTTEQIDDSRKPTKSFSDEISYEEAEAIIRRDEEKDITPKKNTESTEAVQAPEEVPVFTEETFTQSTDRADELKKDPDYFTFLTSAEQGVAVKKDEAIRYYETKMRETKSDDEIWKLKRMKDEILISGQFTDEDKTKVRVFSESPEIQSKMINYEIRKNQRLLKKAEDAVKRCMEECTHYNSMNVISKFLNRDKIHDAEYRLENAIKRKETVESDIYRLEAELYEMDYPNESDDENIVRIPEDKTTTEKVNQVA